MRSTAIAATLFLAISSVSPVLASTGHGSGLEAHAMSGMTSKPRSHSQLARKAKKVRRGNTKQKKCVASASSSPAAKQAPTSSKSEANKSTEAPKPAPTPKQEDPKPKQEDPAPPAGAKGTIQGKKPCQGIPVGATPDVRRDRGPNGSLAWLSCGIESGGWTPPFIGINDVVVADHLGPIFDACKPYTHLFEKYGGQFGIPVVMLAAFAMQESSCNPNTVGGAGEQGLFQITRDKCEKRSDVACRDPDFNTKKGAQYFASQIDAYGGNILAAVGTYNGWQPEHTTVGSAIELGVKYGCRSQNNLDYVHQWFNGWIQNVDAYSKGMTVYDNLAKCHN